ICQSCCITYFRPNPVTGFRGSFMSLLSTLLHQADNPGKMNITEEEFDSHSGNMIYSTFYTLIFVLAVPGNTLALWTFYHHDSTSPSDIFLRQLAIADIFYILILPMRIVYHLSDGHWPFGKIVCRLAGFLFYLNMYCSLYLMSFISLDRCLAVVLPIKSQSVRKSVYAKVVAIVLWVVVTVGMSPKLISGENVSINSTGTCYHLYLEKTSPMALLSTLVAFIIPLATIAVSYILILVKLRMIKQQTVKDKAKAMIILIMMNFLFAFVPYHVSRVMANRVTSALTCVSAILDPLTLFDTCEYPYFLLVTKVARKKL
uniref:Si:dkey-96n2.3 n=1 Tax=Takifugu rubripes TaxID=31033 RepID=H2V936_TAKRU